MAKYETPYLKLLRIQAGFSQRDVSAAFGLTSMQFISNIERGLCLPPDKMLFRLADMYGVDVKKLIDFKMKELRKRTEETVRLSSRKGRKK